MPGMNKTSNEYAHKLRNWYDRVPKAVLAAIAVSYASSGGDYLDLAEENVANEWKILHENGIVPQKPPPDVLAAARRAEEAEGLS